jgi:outer membrane protein
MISLNTLKGFLATLILLTGTFVQAQKFGHLNSALVIESHPDVEGANAQLEAFQKSLMEPFEAKAKAFESKYMFFLEEVNAGTLSRVSAATRQQELQREQQELSTEEQQIQLKIYQKREELLRPILDHIDSVIQAVGQEGKYTMIFDTSVSGAILFLEESNDLTEMVLEKVKK